MITTSNFDLISDDSIVDILYTLLSPLDVILRINEVKKVRCLCKRIRDMFDTRLKTKLLTQFDSGYVYDVMSNSNYGYVYFLTNDMLQYLSNSLTSLCIIGRNYITNDHISTLTLLTELKIHSDIGTFDNIANLTNLKTLEISNNMLIGDTNIEFMSGLTKLTLHGRRYNVTDVGLAKLTNLTKLKLVSNHDITSVGILSLPKLKELITFGTKLPAPYGDPDLVNVWL